MSLIKFLFSRNKKTSVLASQQYGKTEYVEPQEVSILASRKYVKGVEMSISKEEDYLKLVIEDYCTLNDYADKIEEIDKNGIDKLLNNSVLWNNGKQRVNKGIYFVFKHNGNLYNILINDDMIKIDERTRIGEEIADKVISFYKNDKYYRYFRCMHDKNGSSYDTMYYNSNGFEIKALEMSREEFLQDLNRIINSLKTFKAIDEIIDTEKLYENISQDGKEFINAR